MGECEEKEESGDRGTVVLEVQAVGRGRMKN